MSCNLIVIYTLKCVACIQRMIMSEIFHAKFKLELCEVEDFWRLELKESRPFLDLHFETETFEKFLSLGLRLLLCMHVFIFMS